MLLAVFVLLGADAPVFDPRLTLDPRIKTIECLLEGESGQCDERGEWVSKQLPWSARMRYHRSGAFFFEYQSDDAAGVLSQTSIRHGFDRRDITVRRGARRQIRGEGDVLGLAMTPTFHSLCDGWPQLVAAFVPPELFRRTTFTFNASPHPVVTGWKSLVRGKLDEHCQITLAKVKGLDGGEYEVLSKAKRLVYGLPTRDGKVNYRDVPYSRYEIRIPYDSIKINAAFTPESLELAFDSRFPVEDRTKQSLPPTTPAGRLRSAQELASIKAASKDDFDKQLQERYTPASGGWTWILLAAGTTLIAVAGLLWSRSR